MNTKHKPEKKHCILSLTFVKFLTLFELLDRMKSELSEECECETKTIQISTLLHILVTCILPLMGYQKLYENRENKVLF